MTTETPPATNRSLIKRQSQLFFLALVALVFLVTWTIFKPFVIYMFTGVLVAVIALPIDKMWERILPNRIAAFGTMFTLLLIIAIPLVLLGGALIQEAQGLSDALEDGSLEESINDAIVTLMPNQTPEERNETLTDIWEGIEPRVGGFLSSFLSSAVGWIGDLFVGLVVVLFVVYYVLTDGGRLMVWLRRTAPLPPRQVDRLMTEAHGGIKAVFFGQIMTSLIQGALGGVGFFIAGLPGVILWAGLMAVFSLLPVVGAFIVWVPAAIYLLATGDIWQGVFLAAWGTIVVSQVDNFVRPRLIGNRADIHPLFVLIGVLGGVAAFGFIGLFLGPLMVGVAVSVLKVWESDYLDPELMTDPID